MDVTTQRIRLDLIEQLGRVRAACKSAVVDAELLDAEAPGVVRLLGGGNPETALDELETLEIPDVDVRFTDAALVALGLCNYTGTQTDRWRQYLEKFDDLRQGHERTARRWCDTAFEALADWLLTRDSRRYFLASLVIEEETRADWYRFRMGIRSVGMLPAELISFDIRHRFHYSHPGGVQYTSRVDAVNVDGDGGRDWRSQPFSIADGASTIWVNFPPTIRPYVGIHPPRTRVASVDTMQGARHFDVTISRSKAAK